ncbi:hypothetical protein BHM03_00017504 [Ensete ventricosum]|uniref:Uncharacterized protein n=1 Tax=Ensete ventricosum TaxID=4639 RepID=A0A426Z9C4_ENSVE|nr:hypothetical protein B296_00044843 [Ensete ventricosum]RZR89722.1 hypothetical protein BHM03_00017504 [Ensete ventricosum]
MTARTLFKACLRKLCALIEGEKHEAKLDLFCRPRTRPIRHFFSGYEMGTVEKDRTFAPKIDEHEAMSVDAIREDQILLIRTKKKS